MQVRRIRRATTGEGVHSEGSCASSVEHAHNHGASAGGDKSKHSHVQVFVRGRPMNEREQRSKSQSLTTFAGRQVTLAARGNVRPRTFTFDGAFGPQTTQIQVFESVVRPIVDEALAGFNCTIFAYGQTGTGKTHTMQGDAFDGPIPSAGFSGEIDPSSGIVQRAVTQIFDTLTSAGPSSEFSVRVSFLEIYNEEIRDLLAPNGMSTEDLKLFVAPQGGVTVHGLEELPVSSATDVYRALHMGINNRRTAETNLNARSSRSHSIFTVMMHMKETGIDGEDTIRLGKLNLVDLAGSENIKRSGAQNTTSRKREAGNINQSLLTLGRVINSLTEGQPHVPYRESKLTRLLQDSLGGNTKTCIIATLSPASDCFDETLSTLEYAQRAKHIKNTPAVNEKTTKRELMKEFSAEIEKLRSDLSAARSGNGFYISNDTFKELHETKETQAHRIEELEAKIDKALDEFKKMQDLFETEKTQHAKTTELFVSTSQQLEETDAKLQVTEADLDISQRRVAESSIIIREREQTEEQLAATAAELQRVAESAHTDIELLHAKVERKAVVENTNSERSNQFSRHIDSRLGAIRKDVIAFHEEQNDRNSVVIAHIDDLKDGFDTQLSAMKTHIEQLEKQTAQHVAALKPMAHEFSLETSKRAQDWQADIARVNADAEQVACRHVESLGNQFTAMRACLEAFSASMTAWSDLTKTHLAEQSSDIQHFAEKHCQQLEAMAVDIDERDATEQALYAKQMAALSTAKEQQNVQLKAMETDMMAQIGKVLHKYVVSQEKSFDSTINSATASLDELQRASSDAHAAEAAQARSLSQSMNKFGGQMTDGISNACSKICAEAAEVHANVERDIRVSANVAQQTVQTWELELTQNRSRTAETASIHVEADCTQSQSFAADVADSVKGLQGEIGQVVASMHSVASDSSSLMDESQVRITGVAVSSRHSADDVLTRVASNLQNTVSETEEFVACAKKDVATGQTPMKRTRTYPKTISRTRPHEEIISELGNKHHANLERELKENSSN